MRGVERYRPRFCPKSPTVGRTREHTPWPGTMTRLLLMSLTVVITVSTGAGSAQAQTCPEDLGTCLGAARQFTIIADRLKMRPERIVNFGSPVFIDAQVVGSVCVNRATLSGALLSDVWVSGDVVVLDESGTAVRFRPASGVSGSRYWGVRISGDLITGGGVLKGEEWGNVLGVIDTSGTHPKLGECRQAMIDMRQAAATLSGLTSGEDLGTVVVPATTERVLSFTGSGVQVKNAVRLTLQGKKTPPLASTLVLDVADTVDAAVLNVAKTVKVGRNSSLRFTGPGGVRQSRARLPAGY